MTRNKVIVTILLGIMIGLTTGQVNAQGCSDAGLCTIPGMKTAPEEMTYSNRFAAGLSFGQGDQEVAILTPYLTFERSLTNDLELTAKLTYASTDGDLGSHAGLGDLFAGLVWTAYSKENRRISLSTGLKVPLSKPDAGDEEISLPMVYQSSLGTYDLLLGVAYSMNQWGINIGYQQPLTSEIDNTFISSEYPNAEASGYLSTNHFTRKADLLARLSYSLPLSDGKFILRPSILPIYHVADDTYIDRDGNEQKIDGSSGLTLNGNLFAVYHINDQHSLELSLGLPFQTRDARPDGLTREFVVALEYSARF